MHTDVRTESDTRQFQPDTLLMYWLRTLKYTLLINYDVSLPIGNPQLWRVRNYVVQNQAQPTGKWMSCAEMLSRFQLGHLSLDLRSWER